MLLCLTFANRWKITLVSIKPLVKSKLFNNHRNEKARYFINGELFLWKTYPFL